MDLAQKKKELEGKLEESRWGKAEGSKATQFSSEYQPGKKPKSYGKRKYTEGLIKAINAKDPDGKALTTLLVSVMKGEYDFNGMSEVQILDAKLKAVDRIMKIAHNPDIDVKEEDIVASEAESEMKESLKLVLSQVKESGVDLNELIKEL